MFPPIANLTKCQLRELIPWKYAQTIFFFHELRCIRKTNELAQPTSECFMHRNEFDIVQSETRTRQLTVCVKYRE